VIGHQTTMNVCLSSAGRRIALMESFRRALRDLGLSGRVCAVDTSWTAPALHRADAAWQVPSCRSPAFIPAMLELCQREQIGLIVPTIDTELAAYAAHREAFRKVGTTVAISGPAAIRLTEDKVATHTWLVSRGFPTVRQALAAEVLARPEEWAFPLIVKPRMGSAAKGVELVHSVEVLRVARQIYPDLIAQEVAPGQEYTTNLFVDGSGRCRCAVPHLRLEVRGGEVSKARTAKHPGLMQLTKAVVEALPEAYGVFNLQAFLSEEGQIRVIEINARFGGGYPLAYAAGADFPRWLLQDLLGLPNDASFDAWQDGLSMLRYDEAVFVAEGPPAGNGPAVARRAAGARAGNTHA